MTSFTEKQVNQFLNAENIEMAAKSTDQNLRKSSNQQPLGHKSNHYVTTFTIYLLYIYWIIFFDVIEVPTRPLTDVETQMNNNWTSYMNH